MDRRISFRDTRRYYYYPEWWLEAVHFIKEKYQDANYPDQEIWACIAKRWIKQELSPAFIQTIQGIVTDKHWSQYWNQLVCEIYNFRRYVWEELGCPNDDPRFWKHVWLFLWCNCAWCLPTEGNIICARDRFASRAQKHLTQPSGS